MSEANGSAKHKLGTLGTFGGVFTPSILTILGVILFLRLGNVVGDGGLPRALLVIAFANVISLLTSFSLAAIATNMKVRAGGDYYLISRTLGVEFGGAIGLVLFLAQAISIAFYSIGFGEALTAIVHSHNPHLAQLSATVVLVVLFGFAWLGSDWATRLQYIIMGVLFSAIGSVVIGGLGDWNTEQLTANFTPGGSLSFWALFAIFFPAVTGFTQGVSMSGDLKDPGHSIPFGTFAAVIISAVIYFALAFILAAARPGAELAVNYSIMRQLSIAPWLVDFGIYAATISSALASFLGAPRILQSLASDRIFPVLNPFSEGVGPSANPRRGVLLAAVIAMSAIMLGDLNLIAPIVTMFFLLSYGLVNYATYYEARSNSPSFRPRFRWFDKRISLLGGILCLGAVLAIDPIAGMVAFGFLLAIHKYLSSAPRPERWADSARSSRFQTIREKLHAMSKTLEHPRDWRPVILVFSNNPTRRGRIIRFASWISGGSGIITAIRILEGSGPLVRRRAEEVEEELSADISERGLQAFARAIVMQDSVAGFPILLESYGIGPIVANTILLNWFDQERVTPDTLFLRQYGRYLRTSLRFGCNVIILSSSESLKGKLAETPSTSRVIDIWWSGDGTARLMLLLSHLMTRCPEWEDATLRLIACVKPEQDTTAAKAELAEMLDDVRIDAQVKIVPTLELSHVVEESKNSTFVFIPFRLRGEEPIGTNEEELHGILSKLPPTALVLAAEDIELDAEPDAGEHGKIAATLDVSLKAQQALRVIKHDAEKAEEAVAKTQKALAKAKEKPKEKADEQGKHLQELQHAFTEAEQSLKDLKRRLASAQFTADQAKIEAEEVAPVKPKTEE